MFTYKGDSKFSTTLGGLVSIVILSVVCGYLYTLMQTMIKKGNSTFNISTEIVNLSSDSTQYKLFNDYGFSFGVAITDYEGKYVEFDHTYFNLSISKQTNKKDKNGNRPLKEEDLGNKICDARDFPGISQEFLQQALNSKTYCPKNKDYFVSGNYAINEYTFISVQLLKCLKNKYFECKSNSDIESKINTSVITITVVNKYLDFNDYENPIKSFVDDRYFFYLTSDFSKTARIYLQQNEAILDDDYLGFKSKSSHKFVNVEKTIIDTFKNIYSHCNIGILLGPNKIRSTRSVFTLMSLLGNVGGLYGLLQTICGIIVGFFSSQIMLASVFRRLYFTNKINFENIFIKVFERSIRVMNMPNEEIKSSNYQSMLMPHRLDESKSPSEIQVDLSDNSTNQRYNQPNSK